MHLLFIMSAESLMERIMYQLRDSVVYSKKGKDCQFLKIRSMVQTDSVFSLKTSDQKPVILSFKSAGG